jgi:tRNA (Thr-GGU) A37 N-methylase
VKLINVTNNVLHIENIDVIDNTPLIDIKPYVSCFDFVENERDGWLNNKAHIAVTKSDERF